MNWFCWFISLQFCHFNRFQDLWRLTTTKCLRVKSTKASWTPNKRLNPWAIRKLWGEEELNEHVLCWKRMSRARIFYFSAHFHTCHPTVPWFQISILLLSLLGRDFSSFNCRATNIVKCVWRQILPCAKTSSSHSSAFNSIFYLPYALIWRITSGDICYLARPASKAWARG